MSKNLPSSVLVPRHEMTCSRKLGALRIRAARERDQLLVMGFCRRVVAEPLGCARGPANAL